MALGYDDLVPIPALSLTSCVTQTSYLTFLSSELFIFKLEIILLSHDFVKIKQINASSALRERPHRGYSTGLDDYSYYCYYFNTICCIRKKEIANLALCAKLLSNSLCVIKQEFSVCSVVAIIYFNTFQHYFQETNIQVLEIYHVKIASANHIPNSSNLWEPNV